MICPIREINYKDTDNEETIQCLEDECAWYDNANGQCCIKTLALRKIIKVEGGVNTHSY